MTPLTAEIEEELNSLLMKVKEESEKVGLKLNIQKIKIMASGPITSWQIDGETVADFIFLGSKITADGDCSHEIKRHLLLGRKVMTNLDSILKSRDITLSAKVCLVKAMVFPVVMYGCESWTIKKAECRKIDAFELWCWRGLIISPSREYSGLISFRMEWLDLLAVQGTLKSLLQHHSSKASILLCSAFFIVQLSHPYMTTGKTIALTKWTFADKVMSLLFNMLPTLVMTFLPRSKCLLFSWLQSPSAVILEPRIIKSATDSTVSPSICHEVMGPDAMILVF